MNTPALLEAGEALRGVSLRVAPAERYDVIVIGAGQAGLSMGHHLRRRGLRFLILDAADRVGDAWRKRWDSLRLFTPAKLDGLDGLRFPAPPNSFPTKDEMADYLESYAAHFDLPVRLRTRVERVARRDGRYVVTTSCETVGAHRTATGASSCGEIEADHVVVAMASYQTGKIPAFAKDLRRDIVQLHSIDYRNPSQLRPGKSLLVGAGNSGAEIAIELARRGHEVCVAGRDTGNVPFRIDGWAARLFLTRLVLRFVFHHVLSLGTPLGRRAQAASHKGAPLIRVKSSDLKKHGIERVGRVAGVKDGRPILQDGRVLDVANVIWSTGFAPAFSWIDLPVFDDRGEPRHDGGVVPDQPGFYFLGLHFLYAMSSTMIHGVGRDAERIAKVIASRR
jgi:putative flavoprotein involved in K+ transport